MGSLAPALDLVASGIAFVSLLPSKWITSHLHTYILQNTKKYSMLLLIPLISRYRHRRRIPAPTASNSILPMVCITSSTAGPGTILGFGVRWCSPGGSSCHSSFMIPRSLPVAEVEAQLARQFWDFVLVVNLGGSVWNPVLSPFQQFHKHLIYILNLFLPT